MKKTPYFRYYSSVSEIIGLINSYFEGVGMGVNVCRTTRGKTYKQPDHPKDEITAKPLKGRPSVKKHDPPTISGLALSLGFDSLKEFDRYENAGKFGSYLRRARLLIAAAYEKKLHNTNASGAIFALKSMGFGQEKPGENPTTKIPTTLKVEIIESGLQPAASEKDVVLT